jgi:hypothetical protein
MDDMTTRGVRDQRTTGSHKSTKHGFLRFSAGDYLLLGTSLEQLQEPRQGYHRQLVDHQSLSERKEKREQSKKVVFEERLHTSMSTTKETVELLRRIKIYLLIPEALPYSSMSGLWTR